MKVKESVNEIRGTGRSFLVSDTAAAVALFYLALALFVLYVLFLGLRGLAVAIDSSDEVFLFTLEAVVAFLIWVRPKPVKQ